MTELSFTKQFLSALDSRPLKLPEDYTTDPREIRAAYQLPKTLPPKKKREAVNAARNPTVTVTIKPLRPTPALSPQTLDAISLATTIHTLKTKYSEATSHPVERLRLLLKGKPVQDVKTLHELGLKDGETVTLTVMARAGASTPSAPSPAASPAPPAEKAKVLQGEVFWGELGAFLKEKLGKEDVEEDPEHVLKVFREAWGKA